MPTDPGAAADVKAADRDGTKHGASALIILSNVFIPLERPGATALLVRPGGRVEGRGSKSKARHRVRCRASERRGEREAAAKAKKFDALTHEAHEERPYTGTNGTVPGTSKGAAYSA